MHEFWGYIGGTLFVTVMTLFACMIYAACGVFHFTFSFQMSAYLKILINRAETNGPADESIYTHHKKINQFLQHYNEVYSGLLFVEIMVASVMPCGYGFSIIRGFKRNDPAPLAVYYGVFVCFVGPFIMCYCGQKISTLMERLHESAYMSKWYEEKPKVRRDLYTMMLVTVRPVTMNYRLFITYNFECLASIIQGIYTYIMMINNFETAD
ncbi:hypothetical protein O3M35_012776 [Rhynocoris fuscipes]|uniref:Uncharacterized protein n=1 Tax=Rhynocoris fuscipes TaxID=488301 RepID=A0AAW1CGL0_9HEMI